MRTTPKVADSECQSIYESRRYSDTGATVVTIPSGSSDTAEHIYSTLNSESIYEELPDWTKDYFESGIRFEIFNYCIYLIVENSV